MALNVVTKPLADGIEITGARIFWQIDFPVQPLVITESQVNSWLVVIAITGLCLFLTHGIKAAGKITVRQHIAEFIVEKAKNLVVTNMGEYFEGFAPFIAAVLGLSAFSSLSSLTGMFPPTSDINVVSGWAIVVFILITYYKLKCGPVHYVKTLCSPVLLTPLNVISEVATPVSMAFRHYGNVLSGLVISILVSTGLSGLSKTLLGWLPGILGEIPFLQIGLPAVLSVYFDLFSGCLQAFIFAMLTMLYVSGGFPAEEYFKRKNKKKQKSIGGN
ncbi:MAG: F0F1 ATP synthase subunit A [Clostridia bacterium]|nr:F0F1 ATP synthase subunit A [Clostridia bacterium]